MQKLSRIVILAALVASYHNLFAQSDTSTKDSADRPKITEQSQGESRENPKNRPSFQKHKGKSPNQDKMPDVNALMIQNITRRAEGGDHPAQLNLGLRYLKGMGIKKDVKKAVYWLERAKQNGNETAAEILDKLNQQETVSV